MIAAVMRTTASAWAGSRSLAAGRPRADQPVVPPAAAAARSRTSIVDEAAPDEAGDRCRAVTRGQLGAGASPSAGGQLREGRQLPRPERPTAGDRPAATPAPRRP